MREGGKLGLEPATAFESGVKDRVELRLKGGQVITLSKDHPVFTHRGWIEASKVLLSDLVATPRHIPAPPQPLEISTDEVILAAYLLADGCVSQPYTASFTNETPEVIEDFCAVANTVCKGWTEGKSASKAREFNVLGVSKFACRILGL